MLSMRKTWGRETYFPKTKLFYIWIRERVHWAIQKKALAIYKWVVFHNREGWSQRIKTSSYAKPCARRK